MSTIIDLMERLGCDSSGREFAAPSASWAGKAGTLAGELVSIRCTLEAYREHLELLPVDELLESITEVLQSTETDTRGE